MTIHELLSRTQNELCALATTGLANSGQAQPALNDLAGELAAARLGKLGERLQAIGQAGSDRERTAAWAAAWAGVGLVRTRLLKPQVLDPGDVLALPQAPNVVLPRPAGDLESLAGILAVLCHADALARAYAAGRLASLGDEAVPGLLAVQKTCGRCVRFLAVEALGRVGSDLALAGLIDLLGDDDVARPLEATLLAAGERAAGPVAGALAAAQEKDKKRRQAAAKLLWRLGRAEDLRPYLDDGDALLQAYARAALWPTARLAERAEQEGDPAALPAAVVLFEHGLLAPGSLVEQVETLARNRLAGAAAVLRHTPAEAPILVHSLAQLRQGRRSKERERAAAVVVALANPDAVDELLHLPPQHLGLAAGALGEIAGATATWPLIHRAEQGAASAERVLPALGRIGDPAAVPFLLRVLGMAQLSTTRDQAERALVAVGVPAVDAVSQALLRAAPGEQAMAPALERILAKARTPEAKQALKTYRLETDELTRLLGHLADGKEAGRTISDLAQLGVQALDPLLQMIAGRCSDEARKNAALAIARLAPQLSEEQRQATISVLRAQLRAHLPPAALVFGFVVQPVVASLAAALCELDAESATPDLAAALVVSEVGPGVIGHWEKTGRPWLLEVLVQGLQAPRTRHQVLQTLHHTPASPELQRHLWPAVEALVRQETGVYTLQEAVACLRAWGDPRAVPLLLTLKKRWPALTGHDWWKEQLRGELDAALADLKKSRSLKDRLLGR